MVVIVYGYDGSGPGHWQRWLEQELRASDLPVCFPDLSDPTAPQKDIWVAELARVVDAAPSPVTFVAHSLGCWAVDHLVHECGTANIKAALLVAPPSPFLIFEAVESFLPPPRDKQNWAPIAARSLLVGSDDDDFTSAEEFFEIARQIGVELHQIHGAGHINTASGYGSWPFALEWVQRSVRC